MAVLNSLVLGFLIARSRAWGWRLVGAVLVMFIGVYTVLTHIESIAFLTESALLPSEMLPPLVLSGVLLAVLFVPAAVWLLGKWRAPAAAPAGDDRLQMPPGEWVWKLALIAVAYVVLYFTFGYYVAWRVPAVQAYYGGTDPGSFAGQMANVFRDTAWLPFFQLLRGVLWTLVALPVIRWMKGRPWETAMAVGLSYAVLMNAVHLFPNPFMPRAVSMAHLIETASSNFLFGLVVVAVLLWRPRRS